MRKHLLDAHPRHYQEIAHKELSVLILVLIILVILGGLCFAFLRLLIRWGAFRWGGRIIATSTGLIIGIVTSTGR